MYPVDKAGSDIAFICKKFYLERIEKEHENTPTYEEVRYECEEDIIQKHVEFCKGFKIKVNERNIDFILCRSRSKPLLKESRSYAGTLTYSDHRLVVTRVSFMDICLCYKRLSKSCLKFNASGPTSNTNTYSVEI